MDFVTVPVYIEIVAFVCDLKTLQMDAAVCFRFQDEVRLFILPVEQPEREKAEV
jgi:hypothetical protein